MAKQTKTVHKKSRGRPAGQRYTETIPARLEPSTVAAVESWAASNEVSRSEAIRRLVEIGLSKSAPHAPVTSVSRGVERAEELAIETIDHLIDNTAPAEGKAVRRRRLVKGPSAFREDRIDQARPKKR